MSEEKQQFDPHIFSSYTGYKLSVEFYPKGNTWFRIYHDDWGGGDFDVSTCITNEEAKQLALALLEKIKESEEE